jgi:predicted phosphodiesterase
VVKTSKSILVISDYHAPYNHPDAPRFLAKVKEKYQPDRVVCIGDEVDYHAMSFHDHDPNLPSAGDELDLAIRSLKKIYKLFPNVDVVESNHGSMVLRRALSSGMPKQVLKEYNDILLAPAGWKWVFDLTIKTPMGMVYFCHGKTSSPGKLASQYGMSCVQGHYHEKAQITYISTPEKLMFDMHVGCLADDNSLALGYNKINPRRPIVSIGLIIDGVPRILPMILNKNGRWVGNV